jgi:hypothetical protein
MVDNKERTKDNQKRYYDNYYYEGRSDDEKCATLLDTINEYFALNVFYYCHKSNMSRYKEIKKLKLLKTQYKAVEKMDKVFKMMKNKGDLCYIKKYKIVKDQGKLYLVCNLDSEFFHNVITYTILLDDLNLGFGYAYLTKYKKQFKKWERVSDTTFREIRGSA